MWPHARGSIVDALDVLQRDAGPGVSHDDAHAIAVRRSHPQSPPFGHGVARIQEQIQENLLQPSRIAVDQRQMVGQFIFHPDLGDQFFFVKGEITSNGTLNPV